MLRTALFILTAPSLLYASVAQLPISSNQLWQNELTQATINDENLAEWSLDRLPDPNATDHLVFETVHSLLQVWPNTRMRNGHNIVPAIVPKGTLLYHGRPDHVFPEGPEWVATDPEHSYIFSRNPYNSTHVGGWLLTLMATRPLKVIYFDGSSAAKVHGPLDTQDVIVWGGPSDGNIFEDEVKRGNLLCEWGKDFGVDGIARMQMDFEIILCDFTSGVRVVSFEYLPSKWHSPTLWISISELFETVNSGSWHFRFPGEGRIQLDISGLVSFYDTQLVPSLVPIRAGQERWDHRVINASTEDALSVKSRLETNLLKLENASSGIDWKTLLQVIVDRYAERLELVRYLLNAPAIDTDATLDLAKKAQTQLRIMLTPYLLYSAAPTNQSNESGLDWTIPIYKHCSTTHTHSMESLFATMTDSEMLLLQAVRRTSREICRVVTKMWAAGVYAGIDPLLNTKDSPDVTEIARLRDSWESEVERLMNWLDWSIWVKCDPGCGSEEMCYLPTWPIGFPWYGPPGAPFPPDPDDYAPRPEEMSGLAQRMIVLKRLADETSSVMKLGPDDWIRPQPRCIRRVTPHTF